MKVGFDFGGSLIKVSLNYKEGDSTVEEMIKKHSHRVTHQFESQQVRYLNMIFLKSEMHDFFDFLAEAKKLLL